MMNVVIVMIVDDCDDHDDHVAKGPLARSTLKPASCDCLVCKACNWHASASLQAKPTHMIGLGEKF